MFWSVQVWLWL